MQESMMIAEVGGMIGGGGELAGDRGSALIMTLTGVSSLSALCQEL